MTVPTPEEILRFTIPDGHYDLTPERHARLLGYVHAPVLFSSAPGAEAHPVFAHLANQGGFGWTFEDFLHAVAAVAEDGVVIGSGTFDFNRPITVGGSYTVRSRIAAVERKQGRRLGSFDAITVAFDLVDAEDNLVVTMNEVYVVPRRSGAPVPAIDSTTLPGASPGDGIPIGPIEPDDITGLMGVMRDSNPIHGDRDFAIASGFRGLVNQAPANLAYLLNAMASERGGASDLKHAAFTFRDAVIEGDRLEVRLNPVAPDVVDAELVIIGGGVAVTCRAEFGLMPGT